MWCQLLIATIISATKDMSRLLWILLTTVLLSRPMEAYRALVVFPVPSKSHSILGDSLVQLLAEAGHEIVYLTSLPRQQPPPSVTEIDVDGDRIMWRDFNITALMDGEIKPDVFNFMSSIIKLASKTLLNEHVQKLIYDPNEKFDVIIAEWFFSDIYAGLSAVFECPLIWLSSIDHNWAILRRIDDMPNPAYKTDLSSNNQPPLTFIQRVQELGYQVLGLLVQYFHTSHLEHAVYEDIIVPCIRKRGKPVPDFEELRFNASLVLGNSHVSLGDIISLPPLYKPIAGYHLSMEVEPLTRELKDILDSAKHGVIYFSLGSIIKSETLPKELKRSLMQMFGELKQTVLWKVDEDIPHKPSNVHTMKWAPQKSILAHQNCILFITHGGMLSIIEVIHFGKPVIAIPVFGDQFSNVAKVVDRGFGRKVKLSYRMADEIQVAIQEIVDNPSYAARAKELSFIYFHRPVSPAVEIVHWINHVALTRGAMHLRSPALLLTWYQKMYLDLVLVTILITIALKILFKLMISKVGRKVQCEKKKKN